MSTTRTYHDTYRHVTWIAVVPLRQALPTYLITSNKNSKTKKSNLHGFDLHRLSSKDTELLFQVIKAIINQCTSICVRSWCNGRAGCVDSKRRKNQKSWRATRGKPRTSWFQPVLTLLAATTTRVCMNFECFLYRTTRNSAWLNSRMCWMRWSSGTAWQSGGFDPVCSQRFWMFWVSSAELSSWFNTMCLFAVKQNEVHNFFRSEIDFIAKLSLNGGHRRVCVGVCSWVVVGVTCTKQVSWVPVHDQVSILWQMHLDTRVHICEHTLHRMMMIAFVSFKSSLVPLFEGLWSSNSWKFELSGF